MKSDLFLGIDQGTSSTKGSLIDGAGSLLQEFSAPVSEPQTHERCVEQDAEALLSSIVKILLDAKRWAEDKEHTIRGAGLAFQRSGVLAWREHDGNPLHNMITWADTRTYPLIQNFGKGIERIAQQTGLPTIPNFAAGKIHLLQRQFLETSALVGTLDAFVLHRLSGRKVFVTEDTMAARTMLYSLADRNWSQNLCSDFKVDKKRLPRINPSLAPHTTFEGVPIVAAIGDQQAALIGRLTNAKRPLLNLGTIASVMVDTGFQAIQKPGIMTSVLVSRLLPGGYVREFKFLAEITSAVTGSVLMEPIKREWAKDAAELSAICQRSYESCSEGRATAYFVGKRPTMPAWPDGTPNVLVAKPDATDDDRARAIVENAAHLIIRLFEELTDKGILSSASNDFDASGGGSEIDYLLQYLADCTGATFRRMALKNAGSRGAALCAWMSVSGQFDASALNSDDVAQVFAPAVPERRKRYLQWQRLERDVLNRTLPAQAVVEEC